MTRVPRFRSGNKKITHEATGPGVLAVCGLDCGTCEIRLVPTDPEAARQVAGWFREMGWLEEDEGVTEIIERRMVCKGYRGDRTWHWSPDCPLLQCCVDEKHLEHCAQCDEFVCGDA